MSISGVYRFLLLLITIVVVVVFFYHISIGVEVPMYDGNVITVLLIFYFQGGLRNSKHEFTLSSQEYVHELRSGITEEKLFNCLESLRVSLTSNPVRLVPQAFFTLQSFCRYFCMIFFLSVICKLNSSKDLLEYLIGTIKEGLPKSEEVLC